MWKRTEGKVSGWWKEGGNSNGQWIETWPVSINFVTCFLHGMLSSLFSWTHMPIRSVSYTIRVSLSRSDFPLGLLLLLTLVEIVFYTSVEDSFLRGFSPATYPEVPGPFVVRTYFLHGFANGVGIFAISTQDAESIAVNSERSEFTTT